MNLNKLNLNLLRTLNALLANKNVTLAAKSIGASQSSISMSLKQLREVFNDPLLVPGQYKIMQLTPLANSLIGQVREIMGQIDKVFTSNLEFEPQSSQRTFSIGMTDLVAVNLLQPLLNRIEEEAPSIQLRILHPRYLTSASVFESNRYDLLLGMFENEPGNLKQQTLFTDDGVLVCCRSHPEAHKEEITFEDFTNYPLIQFSLEDTPFGNYTNRYLKQLILNKQVNVSTGQGLTPLLAIRNTKYMTMTIRKNAELFAKAFNLKLFKPPFETQQFTCKQYWHPKDDHDPAHRWLRQMLKSLSNKL